MHDIVFADGAILDRTGVPGITGDLAIERARIVAAGGR